MGGRYLLSGVQIALLRLSENDDGKKTKLTLKKTLDTIYDKQYIGNSGNQMIADVKYIERVNDFFNKVDKISIKEEDSIIDRFIRRVRTMGLWSAICAFFVMATVITVDEILIALPIFVVIIAMFGIGYYTIDELVD